MEGENRVNRLKIQRLKRRRKTRDIHKVVGCLMHYRLCALTSAQLKLSSVRFMQQDRFEILYNSTRFTSEFHCLQISAGDGRGRHVASPACGVPTMWRPRPSFPAVPVLTRTDGAASVLPSDWRRVAVPSPSQVIPDGRDG
jgi:hypothetical protein